MTHQRKTIRDAVVTILGNASIVASGKIYSNRNLAVDVADLPVINVYTLPEQSTLLDQSTTILKRYLDVTIEVMAASSNAETTDDSVDSYADLVETALKADQSWGGVVSMSDLRSTEWTKDDRGGDASIGVLRLKYQAFYLL